jgi:hypothetical protein
VVSIVHTVEVTTAILTPFTAMDKSKCFFDFEHFYHTN